jgi:putative ABC transport system permease protein
VMRLQRVDPGFDPSGVYTMRVDLPSSAARDNAAVAAFWTRVGADLGQMSGVTSAGFGTALPPDDQGRNNNNFDLVDSPVPPGGAQPTVTWPSVSDNFFSAFGVPLLEGRLFTASDTGGVPVVVVTKSWAKHYYPGRTVIGRELISGGCTTCPHTVVVGVVADVSFDGLGATGEAVFSPLTEGWGSVLNLFVRSSAPQSAMVQRVRDVIRSASPAAAVGPMTAMDDLIYNSVAQPRHWATILVTFAAAALVMAAVGIFGLLSYAVALRRREIGVRMALGAPSGRVVASMVVGGMRYALGGALVGLALTVMASRWLRGSLYGVSAVDPPTLLAVTGALLVVGLLASWLPARRAAAIDPVEAMRPE